MGDSRRKRDVWRDCEAYSNSVGPRMEAGHESEGPPMMCCCCSARYCMFYLCFSIIIALLPGLFAGNVAIGFNAQTITTTILLIVAICGAVGSLFRMSTPMLVLAITAAICALYALIYGIWACIDTIFLDKSHEAEKKKRGFFGMLFVALLSYIVFLLVGLLFLYLAYVAFKLSKYYKERR